MRMNNNDSIMFVKENGHFGPRVYTLVTYIIRKVLIIALFYCMTLTMKLVQGKKYELFNFA